MKLPAPEERLPLSDDAEGSHLIEVYKKARSESAKTLLRILKMLI